MTGSIDYGVLATIENLYDCNQVDGGNQQMQPTGIQDLKCLNVTSAIQASVDDMYDKFVNKVY